jgi:hypothetical protein
MIARPEHQIPLVGKEQARKYARSQNCCFVILSNGNLHYFWDLESGSPYIITCFPTPESVIGYQKTITDLTPLAPRTGRCRLHRTHPAAWFLSELIDDTSLQSHRLSELFKTLLVDESAKLGWIFHLHGLCVLTDWTFAPLGNYAGTAAAATDSLLGRCQRNFLKRLARLAGRDADSHLSI